MAEGKVDWEKLPPAVRSNIMKAAGEAAGECLALTRPQHGADGAFSKVGAGFSKDSAWAWAGNRNSDEDRKDPPVEVLIMDCGVITAPLPAGKKPDPGPGRGAAAKPK